MKFTTHNRECHAERSEASLGPSSQTLPHSLRSGLRLSALRVATHDRSCSVKFMIASAHPIFDSPSFQVTCRDAIYRVRFRIADAHPISAHSNGHRPVISEHGRSNHHQLS